MVPVAATAIIGAGSATLEMAGLLLIAHAPLATALRAVAEHVLPDRLTSLSAIDVTPDMSLEAAQAVAERAIEQLRQPEVLILTDVFGATPCNAAQRLADGVRVRVVAGVNVPMLWRALSYAAEPLDALVERALGGGLQGLIQVGSGRPQHQARSASEFDAEGRRQDQQ